MVRPFRRREDKSDMELGTPAPKLPEEIFPLEVWDMILSKVESPVDLSSCYRTCGAWRELLEKKKTTFLMAEVFPIISKYLKEEEEDGSDAVSDAVSETSSKSSDAVLNMRLVCKSWKFAVDNRFQNYPTHTDIGFDTRFDGEDADPDPFDLRQVRLGYAVYEYSILNFEKLEEFVQTFDPDVNHFISRFVSYDESCCHCNRRREDRRVARLRSHFTTFLELHGHHIWHIILEFQVWKEGEYNKKMAYNLIRRFLQLMPNLRTLRIHFRIDADISINHSILRQTEPHLDKLLKKGPLPKLDHLTTLMMKNVPGPLEKGLLMTNNHIKQFSLKSTASSEATTALPNFLCDLRMDNLEEWSPCINNEEDLVTLQTLSWPVKSLRMHCHNVKLDSCFQSVSASLLRNTLKRLIICPMNKKSLGKVSKKLDTPRLETLEMIVPARLRNIDFISNCTALTNLQLMMDVRKDEERAPAVTTRSKKGKNKKKKKTAPKSLIKFYGYTTRMLESNIWTVLPGLKRLKIVEKMEEDPRVHYFCCDGSEHFRMKSYEFTRAQYNALQRNQN